MRIRTWMSALVGCMICASALAADAAADLARTQGLLEYDAGHFDIAATHLRRAAERGDQRSAEMLALMYRYGEQLYGNAFRADQALAQHWLKVAMELRQPVHSNTTASAR